MYIFILSVGAFLAVLFLTNFYEFFKNRKFNKWVKGSIDKVEIVGADEIWTIRWLIPESLKEQNPGNGYQYFYFKFFHKKEFSNVDDRNKYQTDKANSLMGTQFYLVLRVDAQGIVREVQKYNGYLQRTIGYGIFLTLYIVAVVILF